MPVTRIIDCEKAHALILALSIALWENAIYAEDKPNKEKEKDNKDKLSSSKKSPNKKTSGVPLSNTESEALDQLFNEFDSDSEREDNRSVIGHFTNQSTINDFSISDWLTLAKKFKRLLKLCAYDPSLADFDLLDILKKSILSAQQFSIERLTKRVQFIVVHNQMDLQTIDLHRRCRCSMVAPSSLSTDHGEGVPKKIALAASCNGCI
jgi:replication initiation and membrane attachment protein DnaB